MKGMKVTITHRYAMLYPGMQGRVVKEWVDSNGNRWLRLDFGVNQGGQRLRQSVPANCTNYEQLETGILTTGGDRG